MAKFYKRYEEIIKYLIFGVLTTFVALSSYYLCTKTFLNVEKPVELQIANIISFILAVIFAYVTNRIYVFKSKKTNIIKEFLNFATSRLATLFIDMGFMFIFVSVLNYNDQIIKILDQIIIILNYILSKFLVFRKK